MPAITIDLPFPPSVNRIWRSGRSRKTGKRIVYRNQKYVKWIASADAEWLRQKALLRGKFKTMVGLVDVGIALCAPDKRPRDLDNLTKAIMDFLQRAGIIINDKNVKRFAVEWVSRCDAPMGARITVSIDSCAP